MEDRVQVVRLVSGDGQRRFRGARLLVPTPTPGPRSGAGRDPQRDAVQPTGDGIAFLDRMGPPHEHEEGRLERVLGLVLVAQNAPTGPQDHRRVPRDQGLERGLVATVRKAFQELSVRQPPDRPRVKERVQVPQGLAVGTTSHDLGPPDILRLV